MYSVFNNTKTNNYDSTTEKEDTEEERKAHTNKRNIFWAINFVRILQMLTKRKTHRIMLLVQYKSSVSITIDIVSAIITDNFIFEKAILKRILRIPNPVMELYTLKVLKSQVPYLGRKWRSGKYYHYHY